ncbi:hypothetical protein QE410_000560 [Microbacterium sp. SORGH_AS 1204]|uniref:hypothetical protein n=1 Tax=Microbacterium sp. SORGH_AS_1204 TaxID=3041785 RepID=UPI002793425B|nr:hypothetical protein [Microbacterium sp. SORGH_AS_1204]MDQ1135761.1 hypothetical protein [Microbacterium sp. SORGH_AS_1204]
MNMAPDSSPLPSGYAAVDVTIRDHLGFSYAFREFRCPLRIAELVLELLSGERQTLEAVTASSTTEPADGD